MLKKGVYKKLLVSLYYILLFLPIAKAEAFGGILRNMGPAVSQVLDLIGQIFYPIGSGSLFIGAYGMVYAKLLLGGILYMLIEIILAKGKLFEDEKGKKYARVIAILIVLISMIAMPQDITMFMVTTMYTLVLIGAIIAVGALVLMFLKGDSAIETFLKAVVYFILSFLFAILSTRLETSGWFGI